MLKLDNLANFCVVGVIVKKIERGTGKQNL